MDPLFWWGLAVATPALLVGIAKAIRTAMNDPGRFIDAAKGLGTLLFFASCIFGFSLIIVGLLATFVPGI